jgi:glycosyltransferase involved in cell wall biosynthesis
MTDAFGRLVRHGAPARLTVLGGGVPQDEIRLAFPPVARERVTVVDRTSEEAVMAAYREHDVLAWPSTYEGFGMVLVEAMSQRLPVVATPVGCAATLVQHERTGLVVPPRDPAALASALARMLEDPRLRADCASAAFEEVRGMTWSHTARLTLDVYARALGR